MGEAFLVAEAVGKDSPADCTATLTGTADEY